MFKKILENIVLIKKRQGLTNELIRNILKETIQYYILDFIYNLAYGKNLILCGGSCLRFCFGLNRLSEDIDLDLEWNQKINKSKLVTDILTYFRNNFGFDKIEARISGQMKKIYLKFPILYRLNVASRPESDKLYVKLKISENISPFYNTEFTPINKFNLNFIVKQYDLSTLMASKIIAVLRRTFRKGKGDMITFKGRDYYDLLWFLQQGIKPNMQRIENITGISSVKGIFKEVTQKVEKISSGYLKEDLFNLFEDSRFIENYVKNYKVVCKKYLIEQ